MYITEIHCNEGIKDYVLTSYSEQTGSEHKPLLTKHEHIPKGQSRAFVQRNDFSFFKRYNKDSHTMIFHIDSFTFPENGYQIFQKFR